MENQVNPLLSIGSKTKKGIFITFEGGEGAGKTTQIQMLFEKLGTRYPVILTREPGGTPVGEEIRDILMNPKNHMHPHTETLLYAASRAEHMFKLIIPTLEAGQIVLCDRFLDSSLVYQGIARNLSFTDVYAMNHFSVPRLPDITFFIDLPPAEGFRRKKEKGMVLDRIEQESLSFHEKVREGYGKLATIYDRIEIVDGSQTKEAIHGEIYQRTMEYIDELNKGAIL